MQARWSSKAILVMTLANLQLGASSSAAAKSFWHRGTDLYVSADAGFSVANEAYQGVDGIFDLGFSHDFAGTGVQIDFFGRYAPKRLSPRSLQVDAREERVGMAGGGYALGYKLGRFKLLGGGYHVASSLEVAGPDGPLRTPLTEAGGFARFSYYLIETSTTSLQLDLGYERGLVDSEALTKKSIEEAITLGLTASVGKFCGGKVLAVGAAVVAVAVVLFAVTRSSCAGFCYHGGDLWPRAHRSTRASGVGDGC